MSCTWLMSFQVQWPGFVKSWVILRLMHKQKLQEHSHALGVNQLEKT